MLAVRSCMCCCGHTGMPTCRGSCAAGRCGRQVVCGQHCLCAARDASHATAWWAAVPAGMVQLVASAVLALFISSSGSGSPGQVVMQFRWNRLLIVPGNGIYVQVLRSFICSSSGLVARIHASCDTVVEAAGAAGGWMHFAVGCTTMSAAEVR